MRVLIVELIRLHWVVTCCALHCSYQDSTGHCAQYTRLSCNKIRPARYM